MGMAAALVGGLEAFEHMVKTLWHMFTISFGASEEQSFKNVDDRYMQMTTDSVYSLSFPGAEGSWKWKTMGIQWKGGEYDIIGDLLIKQKDQSFFKMEV